MANSQGSKASHNRCVEVMSAYHVFSRAGENPRPEGGSQVMTLTSVELSLRSPARRRQRTLPPTPLLLARQTFGDR